jgi:hypothetical protein
MVDAKNCIEPFGRLRASYGAPELCDPSLWRVEQATKLYNFLVSFLKFSLDRY